MAPIIRMPTVEEVPEGARREFIEELHGLYRQAKRPQLRKVSDLIRDRDLAGTASRETIRRMLRGQTVPRNWETVDAVLVMFCELAGTSPEDAVAPDNPWRYMSRRESLLSCWNAAMEALPEESVPSGSPNLVQRNGFDDEPPF